MSNIKSKVWFKPWPVVLEFQKLFVCQIQNSAQLHFQFVCPKLTMGRMVCRSNHLSEGRKISYQVACMLQRPMLGHTWGTMNFRRHRGWVSYRFADKYGQLLRLLLHLRDASISVRSSGNLVELGSQPRIRVLLGWRAQIIICHLVGGVLRTYLKWKNRTDTKSGRVSQLWEQK